MSPMASCILVSYGNQPYLRTTLKSILNQTFNDFDLNIVTDNPSSVEELSRIIPSSRRVKINILEKEFTEQNKKLVNLRNFGIANSSSEYILIHDSDDLSHPKRFSAQVDFMKDNLKCDVSGTNAQTFGLLNTVWKMPNNHEDIVKELFFGNPLIHPSVIMKRKHLLDFKGPYELDYGIEDYGLWVKMREETNFANIGENLLYYRTHRNNLHRTAVIPRGDEIIELIKSMAIKMHIDNVENFSKLHHRIFFTNQYDDIDLRIWKECKLPVDYMNLGTAKILERKRYLDIDKSDLSAVTTNFKKGVSLTRKKKLIQFFLLKIGQENRIQFLEGYKSKIRTYLSLYFNIFIQNYLLKFINKI